MPWRIWCTGSQAWTYFSGSNRKMSQQPSEQKWKRSPPWITLRWLSVVSASGSVKASGIWQIWQSIGSALL
ncbi:hypothetical protein D9M71_823970 [compost metagenome]